MDVQPELVSEIEGLLLAPYWMDIAAGIFEFGTYLVLTVSGHILAKRKEMGGVSMLVCLYLSLLFCILPFAIDIGTSGSSVQMYMLGSSVVSTFFMFMAVIHLLRNIYANSTKS